MDRDGYHVCLAGVPITLRIEPLYDMLQGLGLGKVRYVEARWNEYMRVFEVVMATIAPMALDFFARIRGGGTSFVVLPTGARVAMTEWRNSAFHLSLPPPPVPIPRPPPGLPAPSPRMYSCSVMQNIAPHRYGHNDTKRHHGEARGIRSQRRDEPQQPQHQRQQHQQARQQQYTRHDPHHHPHHHSSPPSSPHSNTPPLPPPPPYVEPRRAIGYELATQQRLSPQKALPTTPPADEGEDSWQEDNIDFDFVELLDCEATEV